MKKLVITGIAGMLGKDLAEAAKDEYEIYGLDLTPNNNVGKQIKIDLTDSEQVIKTITEIKPDYIVHCAALTDVNLCERSPELAQAANALATQNLAKVSGHKVKFVYISTAAVFDCKTGGYKEDDATAPVNVYAKTKLEGEGYVEQYTDNHIIIRTDIIGWKKNQYFVQKIYDELLNNRVVKGYEDVYFSPISSYSMANCIIKLLKTEINGKLHIGSINKVNKYEFTVDFAKAFGLDQKLVIKTKAPDDNGTSRPQNSSLNVEKAIGILKRLNTTSQEISILAKIKGR
jgi:dTDP-4-dehydrorhamnose reductase